MGFFFFFFIPKIVSTMIGNYISNFISKRLINIHFKIIGYFFFKSICTFNSSIRKAMHKILVKQFAQKASLFTRVTLYTLWMHCLTEEMTIQRKYVYISQSSIYSFLYVGFLNSWKISIKKYK